MERSKLVKILKTLTAKEMRQFREYVHCPVHNKHKQLKRLIDLIAEAYPNFNSGRLSKKVIYHKLFPHNTYNEQRLFDLMSYLVSLSEEYLAFSQYQRNRNEQRIYLLKAYREKGLDKLFYREMNRLQEKLEDHVTKDEDFFYHRFLIENEADQFFISREKRMQDVSLQQKVDNLDRFYVSSKLKHCCDMVNRKNVVAAQFEFKMLGELMEYLQNNREEFKDCPPVAVYYQILKTLMEENDEKHYYILKETLDHNIRYFSPDEAIAIFGYAQNYCIKKVNSGDSKFLVELFQLYKMQIEKDVLDGQYMSQWEFKNIVSAGLRLEEYDWISGFIRDYKERIAPEHRDNAYTYNSASFYYSTDEYDKALRLLQSVEFTDVYYHLGAKSMILKMYYDLQEEESLLSLIEAFNIYLRRNKLISGYQRNVHLNLIRFTKRTFKLRTRQIVNKRSVQGRDIKKLRKSIMEKKEITNLEWLLSKVDEIASEQG